MIGFCLCFMRNVVGRMFRSSTPSYLRCAANMESIELRRVCPHARCSTRSTFIRSNDSLGRPHCPVPPLRAELSL